MPRASRALAREAQALFDRAAAVDRTTDSLATFTRVVAGEPRLRKAFNDPQLPEENKRAVLADLFGTRFDEAAATLLATLATKQRVADGALPALLVELTAQAAFTAAGDQLAQVEDELFRFGRLVDRDRDLRSAFTDPRLPLENKQALAADLLEGRAEPRTLLLVNLVLDVDKGRDLGRWLNELAEQAAARRNRVIAEVRTTVELDGARRERLADTLERVTGKQVELRTVLDESILGSVVVRIGDEVFDGSVRRKLELAREALGVSS